MHRFVTSLLLAIILLAFPAPAAQRPNILWLTSEDNSPLLGCYGDPLATTPHLDALAAQGVRYTRAYANTPVCAPTRFTLLTGTYACAMGTEGMRSRFPVPAEVRPYPILFREAGYYCTNNRKTDYNFEADDGSFWDECSGTAHYTNRPPDRPFFAVFNTALTHESSVFDPASRTVHDPAAVTLPPYHPDTPAIRTTWAHYYDNVQAMDAWVGAQLDLLEQSGLADDTIVFYYSDHGGVLPRSKRFLYDTGTRVPLIIRFGKNVAHLAPSGPGTVCDRVVSFVDFAPTTLSLAGLPIPDSMQGRAFLGAATQPAEPFALLYRNRMDERIDVSRALCDGAYRYIRNYLPRRPSGQHIKYLWRSPAMQSWQAEYDSGRCTATQRRFFEPKAPEELYDVQADPWEVRNLAGAPDHRAVLERMRAALTAKQLEIRDAGLLPEGMMAVIAREMPVREYVARDTFPMDRVIEVAELASMPSAADRAELERHLADAEPACRFWAANGLAQLGAAAAPAMDALRVALEDEWPDVRIASAEALFLAGDQEAALPCLIDHLTHENTYSALYAANVLSALAETHPEIRDAVAPILPRTEQTGDIANVLQRLTAP